MSSYFSKKLLLFSVSLLVLVQVQGQTSQAMSLGDCIQYAYDNNPQMRIANLQINDANWRVKENLSTGLPQLSAGVTYSGFLQRAGLPSSALSFGGGGAPPPQDLLDNFNNLGLGDFFPWFGTLFQSDPDSKLYFAPVHSVSGSIQYNQLIFNNSYLVGLRAARYYRDYVNIELNVTRQTLRNNVTDAYLPALLLSENLLVLDKNIANLEKLLNETRAINTAGFAEQLDVDRLELSLSTLRSERGNLARQQEIVVNVLKMAMGMPMSTDIALADNLDRLMAENTQADLTSEPNYMNRPEYMQLLKGRELGALQVELYRKPWMPTVAGFVQYQPGLQGGFGASDSDGFNKWYFIPSAVAGVSVSIPLYDGGGSKARKERAIIQVQTLDAQKQMLENAIQLEVSNARKQYLNAQERVKNQQKNLELAQRIYDTTQKKYKAGVGSSFEITQAESGLYSAQQALMSARHELLTATLAIKRALGAQ